MTLLWYSRSCFAAHLWLTVLSTTIEGMPERLPVVLPGAHLRIARCMALTTWVSATFRLPIRWCLCALRGAGVPMTYYRGKNKLNGPPLIRAKLVH